MMKNMELLGALLLAVPTTLDAHMTLVGVDVPAPIEDSSNFGTDNTWPLRDGGDVWGPPDPGSNVLKCGLLNEPTYSTSSRDSMKASQALRIHGIVHDVGLGGELKFQIKYGPSPEFHRGRGFELLEDPIIVPKIDSKYEWSTTLNLVEPTYSAPATVQVEYLKVNDNGEQQSFFQCIDIVVTDGTNPFPKNAPPGGIGDPDDVPVRPPLDEPLVIDEGMTDFHIVLIILICLLVLCIVGWFVKYRADQIKEEEMDKSLFEPQLEADEKHRPLEKSSSNSADAPLKPPDESKSESDREPSSGSASGANEAGGNAAKESFRHFHFRYVED